MYGVQIGCVILILVTISCAYEVCYEKQLDGTSQQKTCTYSCCGTTYAKYCCGSSSTTYHYAYWLTTRAIIGIVIGVLCLIGLIVGVIICCVCCCKSSPGQRGQVIQNQHQLTVVSGTTNAAYTPGYGPAPVAYPPTAAAYPPAPGAYPPAPAYTQAAYPPEKPGTYLPPQNAAYPPPQGGVNPPAQEAA
ncbi:cysteine and tyrosine-rich protein 1-like isoform X2 [Haliotis rubra]|uniref:cysteine and tyrosine-rich protein 1-like isoform X2 n=1 Tax=Haliotis rubra TaxID=36100 RepID=UPI001EE5F106|nr:cysteine and tyrosine-rich protein 1-like isoform X2 [Haliotis rubra]